MREAWLPGWRLWHPLALVVLLLGSLLLAPGLMDPESRQTNLFVARWVE